MVNSESYHYIADVLRDEFMLEITPQDRDTFIFDLGLDSMDFFQLLENIKDHFGIEISNKELNEENFQSIASMERFIQEKSRKE